MTHPTPEQRDERVSLPLDPETAVRAFLQVDPDSDPVTEDPAEREFANGNRRTHMG